MGGRGWVRVWVGAVELRNEAWIGEELDDEDDFERARRRFLEDMSLDSLDLELELEL